MAAGVDLLNTTLADLKGPLEHTLVQKTPLWDLLSKKGKVSTDRSHLLERPLMGGSPAQGTGVFEGGETLTIARAEKTKKITVATHRVVVPIAIPKKAMKENEGKTGVIKLIEMYPEAVMKLLPVDLDRFFFTGVSHEHVLPSSECQGWNTFNGQKTFSTGITGVTQGLIEFAAEASQNDTTQNLAKSTSSGYVNQFGEVTSYADNGNKTYARVMRDCARWSPDMDAGPDVVFMDFDSFALVEADNKDHVQLTVIDGKINPNRKSLMELPKWGTRVLAAKNIVLTDMTGAAASGLAYLFTLDGIEWIWFQKPELSDFEDRIANQDAVIAKLELQGALLVRNMRSQGAVVGGART